MRRLSLLIGGFVLGGWLISACGSDGDDTTPAAAGTAGTAGTAGSSGSGGSSGSATSCVGLYQDMTPTEFSNAVAPGLGCSSASDVNLICTKDVTTFVGGCGVQCYQQNLGDNAAIKSCTADCVNGMLAPGSLSTTCSDCYTTDVICTAMNCATMGCLTDPAGAQCVNCRIQNGCAPGFYQCSGLPVPGGTAGAAGATQ